MLVGIETDRGPWVQALLAAGYQVWTINPVQAARCWSRHSAAGAKSDPGDAHVLAEIVRLDRAHHRPVAGDTASAPTTTANETEEPPTTKALKALANRLVGILHGCLTHHVTYQEQTAWPGRSVANPAAT